MIGSIKDAFGEIRARPKLLLPGIIVRLIIVIISFTVLFYLTDFFFDIILLEYYPLVDFIEAPFYFYQLYFWEVNIIFGNWFLSGTLMLILLYFYSKLTVKKESIGSVFGFALGKWKELVKLIIVLFLVIAFISISFVGILMLFNIYAPLGLIVAFAWALVLFYLLIRFAVTIPVMAVDEKSIKESLKTSWIFSRKRAWGVFGLLLVIFILSAILGYLQFLIEDLLIFPITDALALLFADLESEAMQIIIFTVLDPEIYSIILTLIVDSFILALTFISLSKYYLKYRR